MTLHVETQGIGQPLLLIHGWGMHGGMWREIAEQLAQQFKVHSVDLPGHGASKATPSLTLPRGEREQKPAKVAAVGANPLSLPQRERGQEQLDEIVGQLSTQFTEPLAVCGWSLGGQLALRWAQLYPAQITKLVLVATTPCFVQKDNWSCAMATETLQEFAASLLQNHTQTLKRFLALQVRGSEQERELLSDLRARLFARGEPAIAALKGGLEILRDTDLRSTLSQVTQQSLLVAGERDRLTPLAAMQYLLDAMPTAKLVTINGASHAPFLSHPQIFTQHLRNFLNERI